MRDGRIGWAAAIMVAVLAALAPPAAANSGNCRGQSYGCPGH